MIIRPEDWWSGGRLKARAFLEVRQLIFDLKDQAYAAAPRRKTDITYEGSPQGLYARTRFEERTMNMGYAAR